MARRDGDSGASGSEEEAIDLTDDEPEIWSTILKALTTRGIEAPVAKRMVHGGNKPSTQSSKARIWRHWCRWRKEQGEPAVPAEQITIAPIINFLGSRKTAGGDYIPAVYWRRQGGGADARRRREQGDTPLLT